MINKPPVYLGLMPPLTGLVGIYGSEITMAGKIAVMEVNENGGVLGRPLKLIIEDDGSLPHTAISAAEKLIEHHKCVAIIGNLLSNSRIAVAYRVAEPRKIPYLNFSFYEGSILSRYFFHFAALPNQQIDKMIPYMQEKYGSKMFFAGNNYEWPRGSIDAAKRVLNHTSGEIVGEEYFPIGVTQKDIDQLLDQVAQSKANVFVPYFAGSDQVMLLKNFTKRGLKKHMSVVMGHYDEIMASHLEPNVREGLYSSNTYFMTVNTGKNKEYLQRLSSMPEIDGIWPQGNGITTNFGEGAYLCVKAFSLAANKAKSLDPEALVKALQTTSLFGPQGKVVMNPTTHHAKVNTFLSRCHLNGQFEIIKNFGSLDPVMPERYSHLRIDERAAREEDIRLQARMMEQMTEGVCLIRLIDGVIIYSNNGLEKMFAYNKDELIGMRIMDTYAATEKTTDKIALEIKEVLYKKGTWTGKIKYRKKGGSTFWCNVSISTLTHAEYGEVWMAVHKDITELQTVQDELIKHRDHLEEMVKKRTTDLLYTNQELKKTQTQLIQTAKLSAIGEMAAGVAHELNQPLMYIRTSAQMEIINGLEGFIDKTAYSTLQGIEEATGKMMTIINHLKNFARQTDFRMTSVQLQEVLEDSLTMFNQQFHIHNIVIEKNYFPRLPEIQGNSNQLEQVFVNLLTNARDALKEKKQPILTIATECRHLKNEKDAVIVSFKDNGKGIPSSVLDKIFDPFFTTKDIGKGTGLGLSISYGIIKEHKGEIHVSSIENEGTLFEIILPI